MANTRRIETLDEALITIRTGAVAEAQTAQRTHINARTTNRHDGAVGHVHSETTVSSSSSEHLKLFLQEDNGREFEANATNPGFGFRTGHRASVIYLGAGHAPVGLINHSTGSARVFDHDVRRLVGGPTNALLMLLTLALMVIGPIVVWTIWGAVAESMRPEWQTADLGELFFKTMTALVVGVLGGMMLPGVLAGLAVRFGILPKPAPSLADQVLSRIQEATAAVMATEAARAGQAVSD
jgi:hypothetical protein